MKQINRFFSLLFAGKLSNPADFKAALQQQRHEDNGADTSFQRFEGEYKDGPVFVAPKRLAVSQNYMTAPHMLTKHNRADWQHVDLDLQIFAARFIETMRRKGIPLYVHSAFRTKREQNLLKQAGRSRAAWPHAPHCQGAAVDIVHGRYHWEMTETEWALMGKVGKAVAKKLGIAVTWGGDWKFYDPAHWEITDWRQNYKTPEAGPPVRQTPRKILSDTRTFK